MYDQQPWNLGEAAVAGCATRPDQRQLVLDAFYDDPLMSAPNAISRVLNGLLSCAFAWQDEEGRSTWARGEASQAYALARSRVCSDSLEPDPRRSIVGAAAIRNWLTDASFRSRC